jgi:hypothetical protein
MYKKFLFSFGIVMICFISGNGQTSGFGAGLMIGEPTGISIKSWVSTNTAWDAGIAWQLRQGGKMHFHADYLWHKYGLIKVRRGRLPLYFGVGGRLLSSGEPHIGVRGVIGLDYMFEQAPVDIFLEIVPIFELVPGTDVDFNGALGARYYF